MNAPAVRFEEVQRMRTWWSVILVLIPSILIWWAVVQQPILGEPWGNDPAWDEMLIGSKRSQELNIAIAAMRNEGR